MQETPIRDSKYTGPGSNAPKTRHEKAPHELKWLQPDVTNNLQEQVREIDSMVEVLMQGIYELEQACARRLSIMSPSKLRR